MSLSLDPPPSTLSPSSSTQRILKPKLPSHKPAYLLSLCSPTQGTLAAVQHRIKALKSKNSTCCDCTASNPSWIDTSLGILVCTRCAGVHRSFSHCIKSLSLDNIHADDLKELKRMGNDRFNQDLLQRTRGLGSNTVLTLDPVQDHMKLPENANVAERKRFILKKYGKENAATNLTSPSNGLASTSPRENRTSPKHHHHSHSPKNHSPFENGYVEFTGILKIRLISGQNLFLRDRMVDRIHVMFWSSNNTNDKYPGQTVRSSETTDKTSSPSWNSDHTVSVRDIRSDHLHVKVVAKHHLFTHVVGRGVIPLKFAQFNTPFTCSLSRKHLLSGDVDSGSVQLTLEYIDLSAG